MNARNSIIGMITGAVLAIAAKLVVPALPVFSGHSLGEANSYCSGVMGALVRGFGGAKANAACNNISNWMLVCNLAAILGLLIIVASGITLYRSKRIAIVRNEA